MIKLYLDCDGVILDTIDKTYEWMQLENLDINDKDLVHEYFVNRVNWDKLIREAGVLKDSLNKIKKLCQMGIYEPTILTTCVSILEPCIKTDYFKRELPNIPVITVPWLVRKDSVVDANGCLLVDDSKTNVYNWNEKGGTGLLFVKEHPKFELNEIDDLLDIPKFNDKVKKLTR